MPSLSGAAPVDSTETSKYKSCMTSELTPDMIARLIAEKVDLLRLPQCVEQSDASPVILGGFVRVSKQRRAIGGPEPLVEMNRPGAWVGNHSPSCRARKIPRRGGGPPLQAP